MNISEFAKPVTAKTLNESLAKRFGKRIALESFTLAQLHDARNKLRTRLSQIEVSESFSAVVESDEYQKSKLFLDVLNAEISERGDIEEEAIEEKAKPDYIDLDGDGDKKEPMKKAAKDKKEKAKESMQVDEFDGVDSQDDADKNLMKAVQKKFGTKKGRNLGKFSGNRYWKSDGAGGRVPADMDVTLDDPVVKMMLDAGILTLNPSALKKYKAMKGESIVREGAEDQAEIVMAAKDMVDRVTGWMEDTAEMKTESMLDLADAIRDEMGVDSSNQYVETIKASLDELYTSMESTRAALSSGVSMLTGEGEMMPPMGAEDPDAAMEPTIDMDDAEGVVPPADDEFAAAPAAAGGEEPAGRETRESVDPRKLAQKLSKKK